MNAPLRIALIGAGIMGRQHYQHLRNVPQAQLCAVADPGPQAEAFAAECGVPCFADHRQMLEQMRPEAVIVANPNNLHVATALDCVEAGVPVLVEKPVGVNLDEVRALVEASRRRGVPVLVGHHRRHNPLIAKAHQVINEGKLGRLINVTALWQLQKPDSYFETPWRREPGAGFLLTNLIHDLDLLRYLCGEVVQVQAFTRNDVPRFLPTKTARGAAAVCQRCLGQPDRVRCGGCTVELGAGRRRKPRVPAPGRPAVLSAGRYPRSTEHSPAQALALRRGRLRLAYAPVAKLGKHPRRRGIDPAIAAFCAGCPG